MLAVPLQFSPLGSVCISHCVWVVLDTNTKEGLTGFFFLYGWRRSNSQFHSFKSFLMQTSMGFTSFPFLLPSCKCRRCRVYSHYLCRLYLLVTCVFLECETILTQWNLQYNCLVKMQLEGWCIRGQRWFPGLVSAGERYNTADNVDEWGFEWPHMLISGSAVEMNICKCLRPPESLNRLNTASVRRLQQVFSQSLVLFQKIWGTLFTSKKQKRKFIKWIVWNRAECIAVPELNSWRRFSFDCEVWFYRRVWWLVLWTCMSVNDLPVPTPLPLALV